jgi:hypothetical protein
MAAKLKYIETSVLDKLREQESIDVLPDFERLSL